MRDIYTLNKLKSWDYNILKNNSFKLKYHTL